ncbi:MAG: dynamin family protein [Polyangiaceae bacterium]
MNANHARSLVAGFRAFDSLLREIEVALVPSPGSPFFGPPNDITPAQQTLLLAQIQELRAAIIDALTTLGIGVGPASGHVRSSITTRLTFADIALQEIAPKQLRGYGDLQAGDTATLQRVLGDMARRIRATRASLEKSADFHARIEMLENAPIDRDALSTLDAIVSRRGLVELRGLFDAVLAQLEQRVFEIAVFGRVSCGKSSLLNAALGIDVLPVGVTPVTAVPTRIERAEHEGVLALRFADGTEKRAALGAIADFVAEEQNPGNEKHVTRVTAYVASERIPEGVALVDTPGVAALGKAGSRETYAYLPRCDLGIVAIDAGASPSHEDVQLLRMLRDSSIEARVVVTKIDRLSASDREAQINFIRRELTAALDTDVSVHGVSSVGAEASLARAWFDDEIAPLAPRARSLAEASIHRKMKRIRDATVSSLRAAVGTTAIDDPKRKAIDTIAGEAERTLEKHLSKCEQLASAARDVAPVAIQRVARILGKRADADDATLDDAAASASNDATSAISAELIAARDRLRELLVEAGVTGAKDDLQVDVIGAPVVKMDIARSARVHAARWLPKPMRAHRLLVLLSGAIGTPLERNFSRFGAELRTWARRELDRLSQQFAAAIGPLRARHVSAEDRASVLEDLRALGDESNGEVAPVGNSAATITT